MTVEMFCVLSAIELRVKAALRIVVSVKCHIAAFASLRTSARSSRVTCVHLASRITNGRHVEAAWTMW